MQLPYLGFRRYSWLKLFNSDYRPLCWLALLIIRGICRSVLFSAGDRLVWCYLISLLITCFIICRPRFFNNDDRIIFRTSSVWRKYSMHKKIFQYVKQFLFNRRLIAIGTCFPISRFWITWSLTFFSFFKWLNDFCWLRRKLSFI